MSIYFFSKRLYNFSQENQLLQKLNQFFVTVLLSFLFSINSFGQINKTNYNVYNDQLKQLKIQDAFVNNSPDYTLYLIKVWDSLNKNHHNVIYDKLPSGVWQEIFEKKYNQAIQQNNDALRLKIAYPLSFVCHTRSSFKEGLPVLEYLYLNKKKLDKSLFERVLIKLEEEYRFFNQMANVLKIRNERIEHGFIKTFWEIYASCGLFKEAIDDYKLFEPLPENDSRKRLVYYLRLGDLYFESKQIDSAEKYFKIGLSETERLLKKIALRQVQEEGNFTYWIGWFNGLIGNCYMERGDFVTAKKLHLYFLSLSTGEYRLNSLFPLSICYIKTGELQKAKITLDSVAFYIAGRTIGKVELNYFKTKSDYFHAIGNDDSAFHYLQTYNHFKDSSTYNILKNQSSLLTAKMEIEKRRKELVVTQNELVKTKLASSIQEGQLYLSIAGLVTFLIVIILVLRNLRQKENSKKLIEAKNRLLEVYARNNLQKSEYNEQLIKELHHRVKNNLQNIYSLLNIQKRRIDDEHTIELVTSIQNRINSMAIVHESLYADENIEMTNFKEYAIKLVDHLRHSFQDNENKVVFIYSIDSVEIKLEKIILLGLIINEIVSNIFKHASNATYQIEVNIDLQVKNNTCTLLIKDNGPGFDMTKVNDQSLGLKLIQTLCQQLEAKYNLFHKEGVEHTITFSI